MAIISGIPISAIIEGLCAMTAVVFSTYRNERNVVPKEKIKDITLGVTIAHTQIRFFTQVLKNKFKFFRKKDAG